MARVRIAKRPMSEMNVVPYIDVMLVLLVIFMITAPLLSQGVKVELPKVASEPIQKEEQEPPEPLVVTVDKAGDFFLNVGENKDDPIAHEDLVQRVGAVLRRVPKTPVYVRGDQSVDYGKVVLAMSLLQQAGAPSVGLLTEPPEDRQ
jgi:biopolymer transport protein TolR